MTLTEFLLARIAQDEYDARLHEGASMECLPGSPPAWWQRLAARALAECEAKRRIVGEHAEDHNCVRYIDPDDNRDCETLRALASVYADHPDYPASA